MTIIDQNNRKSNQILKAQLQMKVNYQKTLNNGLFKDLLKIFIIF